MKKLLRNALSLLLAVLFPGLLFAQGNPDYTILLNAGNFVPTENIKTVNRDSELLRSSLFGGKYYVALQFRTLPSQEVKDKLSAAGIQLFDYLPNLAYTATLSGNVEVARLQAFPVRSVFVLNPAQKTVPALLQGTIPAYAVKAAGFADVTVITYEKLSADQVGKALLPIKATILENMPMFRSFTIRVPQQNITKLIQLPFVQWVEPIDAPNVKENLLGRTLHRVNVLNDGVRNLKGDGIKIGIWDEGEVSPHLDFTPINPHLTHMETGTVSSHSTHVAGTIGGRGLINPKARGMAPNARLYSYNFSGNIQTEMATAIPTLGLAVSSHSYGSTQTCGVTGAGVAYSSTSRSTDLNLNANPSHLHVHSAGNSQTACTGGWSTITGSGKTSKNNILVANITSTEAISGSSSFGPVHDGRVKPEVSSFGTNVLSTYIPLNTYGTITGTSMATPGVSGTVALLVQRYQQLNANVAPISSLIKGTLCNTAQDLGNPGPDYKFGFGRINALRAVKALEQNRYVVNTIATGATNNHTITVPAGAASLKVMLTWNDPAGTVNSTPALINNLDLSVINGATSTLPWILNPNSPANNATRGNDNFSNIEQVTIANPTAGTYTLRVNGVAIPTGPNQQYSLTWEIDQPYLEVIFPNGGEALSPGAAETITWDNSGVTSNQTIQYSINNGATWTTISSTVPAATTRYSWTVPAGLNTSTALVKVTSGTLTDVSDATFKILGTPTSLSATAGICAGSLNFSWPAVTNATNYDLFKLDMTTGEWVSLASNVTGTTYSASGFTPGASMWFTISARNNTTGSVSDKALAINRVLSSGSSVSLGSITGQTTICSNNQQETYSVPATPGVTSYTWTVPTGATIVSGQGTTTLVVNYAATSTSGSISVSGITSGCQTSPSSLPVTVNQNLAPPVSSGDQIACANASPGLTPNATVPAGFSVVWYNAATGGSVVSNPFLSTPGSVTYYAVTRSNSGICESTNRTAVTLTLNSPLPATVSASGATALCEGSSVTLTASAGSSYLWNNGDTTRSITVSAAGNFSVSVTEATGCATTSAATAVTILPKPEVSLSAWPTTQLLPGVTAKLDATVASGNGVTFSWFKNGTLIPGATAATLPVTIDDLGVYTVSATDASGCNATSKPVTVSEAASNTVFIYPNPNNGQFQIRYNNLTGTLKKHNIIIFDSKGALVQMQTNSISTAYGGMGVDLRGKGKGVYWVILQDDNGNQLASERVVVY
jgi:hypothetical protein